MQDKSLVPRDSGEGTLEFTPVCASVRPSRRYLDQGSTFWAETWQVPSLVPGIETLGTVF